MIGVKNDSLIEQGEGQMGSVDSYNDPTLVREARDREVGVSGESESSFRHLTSLVRDRRSLRRYQARPVDPRLVEKLLEAARWAPSNFNSQPWRFVVSADRATNGAITELLRSRALSARGELGEMTGMEQMIDHCLHYFQVVKESPVIIAVGYRPQTDRFEVAFDEFFSGESRTNRWSPVLLSVGMASQNLLLAAHAAGLGACVFDLSLEPLPASDVADLWPQPSHERLAERSKGEQTPTDETVSVP